MSNPSTNTAPPIISSDGRCLRPVTNLESREVIEIVIDGTRLAGGTDTPTLLGQTREHLPESLQYQLERFEPMEDGRCLARYRRIT